MAVANVNCYQHLLIPNPAQRLSQSIELRRRFKKPE
jgi:hypothetical protein